jgi:8-oxo-dGTP pyrophosphatase MutT (NUDIX family)
LPAGSIELGESPREAIIREVKEETGYDVVVKKIIDVFGGKEFRYTYPNGHEVEYVITLFQCEIVGGSGQFTNTETTSIKYFAEDEMPQLALPYPVEALFLKGHYDAAVAP